MKSGSSLTHNSFRADLHCHSTCSDGTFSPLEIIEHAKEIGLSGISITDHDTVEAYKIIEAEASDIEWISGVEFSTVFQGESVHILGYSFDLRSDAIAKLCEKHKTRRKNRNEEILSLLRKNGLPVENIQGEESIGRPHIALEMVRLGYVSSVQEAFHQYLGNGKSCYAQGESISLEETLDTIKKAKGLAVIAHPHLIKNRTLLRQLLKFPFDGIECYYAKLPPTRESEWVIAAKERGWLITGGSDFHGDVKPTIPLGCSWVSEETFRILKTHFDQAMSK